MASTYVNNLRLEEIGTGEQSGTWGDTTNTNLEIIGQAVAWGTRAIANDSTDNITIADGALDADRCLGLKLTGGGQACTVSLLPNTSSKTWFMYNATAADLTFTCGSGGNVVIPAGQTKVIATDGLGSGGVVHDLLTAVNLAGTTVVDDLTVSDDLTVTDDMTVGGTLGVTGVLTTTAATVFNGGFASNADSTMGTNKKLIFRDSAIHISSTADGDMSIAADDEIDITSTLIDVNGNLDVSGTALVTGVLTTTAATVFNGGFAANAASTITTADNAAQLTLISTDADANVGPILKLHRNSATPADDDVLGRIQWIGEDSAGNANTFGTIQVIATDVTDGSEDAKMVFSPVLADAFPDSLILTGAGATFNSDVDLLQGNHIRWKHQAGGTIRASISAESADDLQFNTGSSETARMTIDTNGLVGIGTDSPSAGLTVQAADGNVGGTIMITSTGVASAGMACDANGLNFGADTGGFVFKTGGSANDPTDSGTSKMQLTSGGVLEVGEIQEQTQGTDISVTMVSEDAGLALTSRSATDAHSGYLSFVKTPATSGNYTATASGDRLGVINFVGVNTAGGADNGAQINVEQTGTASGTVPAKIGFLTNEVEAMNISSTGLITSNLGMKIDFPQTPQVNALYVQAYPTSTSTVFFHRDNTDSIYVLSLRHDAPTGTSGTGKMAVFQNREGTTRGSIHIVDAATVYATSSDYRLKTDAQPITGATARLKSLNPVNFEWIGSSNRSDGFLAHEAQAVVPEAVVGAKDAMIDERYVVSPATGDIYTPATDEADEIIHSADAVKPKPLEDGQAWRETTEEVMGTRNVPEYQQIDQSKLVPLLVATIQELEARITALEA